jgi:prepilin-type processing-associated H-X9-DG protein
MPQLILPLIPPGATRINDILSVQNKDGWWYYFAGINPIFSHENNDQDSFRMYTSQLIASGQCKNSAVAKAFGVSASSVKRGVKKFKEGGIKGFFQPRKGRGSSVLTEEVINKCQEFFDSGWNRKDICEKLDIEYDTLRKAISDSRLHEPCVNKSLLKIGSSKSERTVEDAKAGDGLGVACTRTFERTLASVGELSQVSSEFENCYDLTMGGVLCSLPALDACGLYRHLEILPDLPSGYYSEIHIMTTFAFMFLCRIKSIEQLRFQPAGELGKQIGLDRIPEVKTMRKKLKIFSKGDGVKEWAGQLGKDWMESAPDLAGVLFVDGHVSLYFGNKTKLPKRYSSGLKLCLSGTSFYYVNDILGQPFFYIEKPVDPGMIKTLENDIVPRLINDIPGQPTQEQLDANKKLHRFVLVFDREGYSPGFFKRMWKKHRIACVSYHKYPGDKWEENEFEKQKVKMPHGEIIEMELAERGSLIGSKKSEEVWVREVRRETKNGHQTSIISTGYLLDLIITAICMFSRWTQENFFKYMNQHFDFDKIMEYETESIPGSTQVINPIWKDLDSKISLCRSKLNYRFKKFGDMELHPETDQEKLKKQIKEKKKLRKEIDALEKEIENIKEKRSDVSKHIDFKDLPDDAKFEKHNSNSRLLLNTIKMIDYRAETGMSLILKEFLHRDQDARAIIRELFKTEADLFPDPENKILNVRLHRMTTLRNDEAVKKLLEKLNESETFFPGTDMKIRYYLAE